MIAKDINSASATQSQLSALLLLMSETKEFPDEEALNSLLYLAFDLSCNVNGYLINAEKEQEENERNNRNKQKAPRNSKAE